MAASTHGAGADERRLSLRVMTMPRDTNQYGTVFGGLILSYIDQAGFAEARRHGIHRWVTAALDEVVFKAPVHLGDIVCLYTRVERFGTTSIRVAVDVEAERYESGERAPVTTASITLVAVGSDGEPIPYASEPTVEPVSPCRTAREDAQHG